MDNSRQRCWAEIDLDALAANYSIIRQKAGNTAIMAVVKADAYGHGDSVVAPLFDRLGAAWFAVSCLAEARRLRRIGIEKPILILGYTAPEEASELAQNKLTQCLPDLEYARVLSASAEAAGCRVSAHLALDTGMGRIGFGVLSDPDEAVGQMAEACALPGLCVSGAFTHFSVADSVTADNLAYTRDQAAAFAAAVQALRARGIVLSAVHCCNSSALFCGGMETYDLVRPGIVQYGLQPSDEVAWACGGLRPAMSLRAAVAMVKDLRRGQYVSYGRTFCAPRDMRIATVTAGYADGYPRSVSNRGVCSIHGRPAPQIGNVCMDQMMLDVSGIPDVHPGDTAVLFGAGAADSIDELAAKTNTINYTIICGVSRRVPRVYLKNGTETATIDYLEK